MSLTLPQKYLNYVMCFKEKIDYTLRNVILTSQVLFLFIVWEVVYNNGK